MLGEVRQFGRDATLVFNTHMKELCFKEIILVTPFGQIMELVAIQLVGKVMK